MELFDKAKAFAKTAADKTGVVIEDTRLKAQILNDEKSIKELEVKIGAYFYEKFAAGEEVDEAIREYCTAISVHKTNIEEKKSALGGTPTAEEIIADVVAEDLAKEEAVFEEEDVPAQEAAEE